MARIQHSDCGPAQALARAAIECSYELRQRGNSITVRWTPAHAGVEGSEHADARAKRAAEGEEGTADPEYLREASLSRLTRKATEARSNTASEWIQSHVRRERRYRPPPGRKLRKGLGRVRKELAGCFYQLLSGHAATAPHLRRIGQAPNDRCWWCGSGERQTRHHLFIRCRRWAPEVRRLWQRVEEDCEWESPRAPSVRLLFRGARATPVVLELLEDTRVWKMPGLALFGVQEESDPEEIVLWSEDEEVPGSDNEEGGPGPP